MINGINNLVITKLDVMTGLGKLKIATHYKTEDGKIIDYFTSSTTKLYNYEPIYEELEGWDEDITTVSYDELPAAAKKYIEFIEKYLGINVYLVSVGPERSRILSEKSFSKKKEILYKSSGKYFPELFVKNNMYKCWEVDIILNSGLMNMCFEKKVIIC